jgi:hypothetical protein
MERLSPPGACGHAGRFPRLAQNPPGPYTVAKERTMAQSEIMTLHEKLQIGMRAFELEDQGKFEEAKLLHKQIPLAPYLAKFLKDHIGLAGLLQGNWNLSEAEAEYGPDFLSE